MTAAADLTFGIIDTSETVLWRGKIGFGVSSSLVTLIFGTVITFLAIMQTWGSYSLAEFCDSARSGSRCAGAYFLIPFGLVAISLSALFDVLERRALTSRTRHGYLLLTDKRFLRLSDWPWRRVKSFDYLRHPPKVGSPGVIKFSRLSSIIVGPENRDHLIRLMLDQKAKTP